MRLRDPVTLPLASAARMRPRHTVACFALAFAALLFPAKADPLASLRPPTRTDTPRVVPASSKGFDGTRNSVVPTTVGLPVVASATSTTTREDTAQRDDAMDATLATDVSSAVAFARTTHDDVFDDDSRYANVVREAVEALETRLLDDRFENRGVLSPDQVRRDATLREALTDLRDEIDRALPLGGGGHLPPEVYYEMIPVGGAIYGSDGKRGGGQKKTQKKTQPDINFFGDYDSYDEYSHKTSQKELPSSGDASRVAYADVGVIGGFMQSMTYAFSGKKYDSPTLFDDWMRCSTLAMPCSPSETFRRCTYEPKNTVSCFSRRGGALFFPVSSNSSRPLFARQVLARTKPIHISFTNPRDHSLRLTFTNPCYYSCLNFLSPLPSYFYDSRVTFTNPVLPFLLPSRYFPYSPVPKHALPKTKNQKTTNKTARMFFKTKKWYRERRSRINAPLDWPYCADDLGEVYEYCTQKEKDSGVCDPRVARSRAVFERARELEYERQTRGRRAGGLY